MTVILCACIFTHNKHNFGCICVRAGLNLPVQMWVLRLVPGSPGTMLIDRSIPGCHGDDDGCVLGYHGLLFRRSICMHNKVLA